MKIKRIVKVKILLVSPNYSSILLTFNLISALRENERNLTKPKTLMKKHARYLRKPWPLRVCYFRIIYSQYCYM